MKNPPPCITECIDNQLNIVAKPSGRMEYIDALRGLTMFLVVVGHIWTFVVQKESAVTAQFFMTFRMPIFFFISGFVGYKSSASFTLKDFGTSVWKKFSMALIPCFVFFTLYSLCFYPGIATVVKYGVFDREFFRLCLSGKSMINVFGGYWFVPELFIYFLCYYIVLCLCSLCNKAKYASIILFCFAIVHFLMFDFRRISNHINFEYEIVSSNILYMSLGLLVRQYFNRIERLLRNEWVNAAAIITWITLFSLNKYNGLGSNFGCYEILRFPAIFVVFSFFYNSRNFFAAGGRLSKIMQYIGRHTLDIYLLHYFALPILPASVLALVASDERDTIPLLAIGIIIAAMIVALCLLVSGVVRTNSNVLAHYLFGAKRERTKSKS